MTSKLVAFLVTASLIGGMASAPLAFAQGNATNTPGTQPGQSMPNQGMMGGQNSMGNMDGMMSMMGQMNRMMDNCNRMMESADHSPAAPAKSPVGKG